MAAIGHDRVRCSRLSMTYRDQGRGANTATDAAPTNDRATTSPAAHCFTCPCLLPRTETDDRLTLIEVAL